MNILFLTHRLPYPPNRGDRLRAFSLLREMSTFASVSLFSLVHDADEEASATTVPFVRRVATARVTPWRNHVRGAVLLGTSRPLTHALLDAPDARSRLAGLVASDPPDLVVAFCSSMAKFAMQRPLADMPFVLDLVDVDSAKWADFARCARGIRRWIYRREARTLRGFERKAVRRARMTFVVNDRERDALVDLGVRAQIRVVPNILDLDPYLPSGAPAPSAVVVFTGVMNYRPNEEAVLWFVERVWPRVRSARPDARFSIVGASPTRSIRRLAERDPSVDVTGTVTTVQPHLWRAAVAVAPLQLARGLQNKVLEALAAGLPVVATSVVIAGLPEAVRSGCSTADTPNEFAEAVVGLLALTPLERRERARAADLRGFTERIHPDELQRALRQAAGSGGSALEGAAHDPGGVPAEDCTAESKEGIGPVRVPRR